MRRCAQASTPGVGIARAHALGTPVCAGILRSIARSSAQPVWKSGAATNLELERVVAAIGVQSAPPRLGAIGRACDVPGVPLHDGLALIMLGSIPSVAMELVKVWRMSWNPP